MWDLHLRKSVVEAAERMTPDEIRALLRKKGIPISTFRYWRKCYRDGVGAAGGILPGRPSRIREIVREEVRKAMRELRP